MCERVCLHVLFGRVRICDAEQCEMSTYIKACVKWCLRV